MKKFLIVALALCLMLGIFSGCNAETETVPAEMEYQLDDTGASIVLPTELGFERMESELNDYFGIGANGEWCIIVNRDEKTEYTLEDYAKESAKVNNADDALKDADGNYYFIYETEEYHFYTAVREGQQYYYRVAFYCFNDVWDSYKDRFSTWASTIQVD